MDLARRIERPSPEHARVNDDTAAGTTPETAIRRDGSTALEDAQQLISWHSQGDESVWVDGSTLVVDVRRNYNAGQVWRAQIEDLMVEPTVLRLDAQVVRVQLGCRLARSGEDGECWRLDEEPYIFNVGYTFHMVGSDGVARALATALRDVMHAASKAHSAARPRGRVDSPRRLDRPQQESP